MKTVLAALMLCALSPAASAQEASYVFAWEGAGGYAMQGALRFDPGQVAGDIVRAQDLSCFEITGTQDGQPLGHWALGQVTAQTTWRLHFYQPTAEFFVEGQGIWMPQAWNMNGWGDDCGEGGFGFNIGDQAQDLCHDNRLLADSQIDPQRAFPAQRDDSHRFGRNACRAELLLGALTSEAGAAAGS